MSTRIARAPLLALTLAGMVALGLFASACGDSSGAKVAQIDSTSTTTSGPDSSRSRSSSDRRGALVAFSACMRKNGVPNFPDPKAVNGGYRLTIGPENGIDAKTPQFKTAQQTCKKLLPNGGKPGPQEQANELQDSLKFAQCMRAHGVPQYPDPKVSSDGGIELGMVPRSSADRPKFESAENACRRLLPQ